jgi:hypothetical protein
VRVQGLLTTDGGDPLVGWHVYASDERTWTYSLSRVTTGRDGAFLLESDKTLPQGAQPQLTFYVLDGERVVNVMEPTLKWTAEGDAEVALAVSAPPPPVFYLHGRVWNPVANAGVYGAVVRAVDRAGVFEAQAVAAGPTGLFELWLPYKEGAEPDLELGVLLYGAAVPILPEAVSWDIFHSRGVWLHLAWDISGAVASADGVPAAGARVEAWDAGERFLAAADAGADGRFTLHLPREQGKPSPPQPTLRIYRSGQLVETIPGREAAGTMVRRNGPNQGPSLVRADVSCVRVEGSRATISGTIVESTSPAGSAGAVGNAAWFDVEDGGAGSPDRFSARFGSGPPRCDVSIFDRMQPLASGAVTVTSDGVDGTGVSEPNKEPFEVHAKAGRVRWSRTGFGEVDVRLSEEAGRLPDVYRVAGTAIDRRTRRGVAGLRVEAWNGEETFMVAVATTAADGRFAIELLEQDEGVAPTARFRFYRDGLLVAQPDLPLLWKGTEATVFAELDAPAAAPRELRVAARVIDRSARTGLAGLRVEAWDSAPRDGGSLGVAAVTAADGSFELVLPAATPTAAADGGGTTTPPIIVRPPAPDRALGRLAPEGDGGGVATRLPLALRAPLAPVEAPAATPPSLFFRVYVQERLLETATPAISWSAEGIGTAVLEVGAPTASSQEVGLHELGESIATTVDRVQTELTRYPTTMGAYVLDEIALDMPVEMRVDELGQVRTKVVDATTPEKNVGQVRMKVRPVLGARQAAADVSDQPLSVLAELTPQAIATLEAHRIYSVEDLTRAASSGAGRAALSSLGLGVELEGLLAKASLLAFSPLPRAVREALLRIGVTSLPAFAKRDATGLAAELSTALEQVFTGQDVTAWQATVREALAVPRPSDETGGTPS